MTRRTLLAAPAAALSMTAADTSPIPIIDTHIHLFDTARPQGIPWPPKNDPIRYKTSLPSRFREVSKGLNVRGAIEVECSPWFDDNQWVLDVMAKDKIMVGTIGDLEPADPDFPKHLERFHKNPLFLGIRYGYLWDRDLRASVAKPAFIDGLKRMAQANLTLDTANPSVRVLEDVIRISDQVPTLRVVLDHLPKLPTPPPGPARKAYDQALAEIGKRKQVYVKLSAVLTEKSGRVSHDLADYRPKLDELFGVFGEDRVVYGSDWPNSEPLGPYPDILSIVQKYFATKSRAVAEKYFWKNSVAAYRWVHRDASQPKLA
ncbi:MAG: amidohydrolase family protein [Bryobacteraceae bacterium]